ncbi:hypothetical protein KIL84_002027 [Mauremys mutica]|uniref:Epithelial membrane protein 3 n=1 Tax=Mauremys mutica TaxID=74926 RepID=A0A9D4B4F4_9SAUR|nr:hypothetical protein KIL84_002027 [Mauremys mutica]
MSFLLFAITGLHVLILVLLFVATLDKSWWVLPDNETVNLWYDCLYDNTTQSWMCASVAESRDFAFILFMYQLYTMERGGLFYATGVCQLLACISVFTAALIYAIHVDKFHLHRQSGGSFGYCFVLAWLAFPLALLSGIMYIHLRKRE